MTESQMMVRTLATEQTVTTTTWQDQGTSRTVAVPIGEV